MRIGFGYDSHRLAEGRDFILGGVKIPFEKGLLGHSDADVLTHAVIDALLGATANKDIGRHFPDTDDKYKGVSSVKLLSRVMETLGHRVINIDCTVLAQRPKLSPYIDRIRETLAGYLQTDIGNVSVKAKTEEGADAVGRGELVKAYAIVLID
jgi:2-C-methyl-D-erythritol 2,4-cyclodiphosphate synthase